MADTRKYPKVRKMLNWDGEKFPLFEQVVVQEKLDGSNVTIEFIMNENKEVEMKLFSRTAEIKNEEGNRKTWGKLIDWADTFFSKAKVLQFMDASDLDVIRFHGEWLMMAKLPYNKSHKNTFWLFDVVSREIGVEDFKFSTVDYTRRIGNLFNLNNVPIVANKLVLNDVFKDASSFVDGQKTLLPASDSPREGVVVKLLDGSMRMKFVSTKFKEGMGAPRSKNVPLFQINAQLVTDNMIQKYIYKLKEEGIIDHYVDYTDGKTIGTLFKHSKKLIDDFMEEEFANFLKLVTKAVNKESGKSLKNYINKQVKLQEEMIVNEQREDETLTKIVEEDDSEMVEL